MESELMVFDNREEWLEERRRGIGASEVAAILGVSKFQTPLSVWSKKVGLDTQSETTKAQEWGLRLEPVIIDWYKETFPRRKVKTLKGYNLHINKDDPIRRCTPDALQEYGEKGEGALQIKTTNQYLSSDWDDDVPMEYQVQCQYEMAVTGLSHNTIAVLIGGQDPRHKDLDRNDSFIEAMLDKVGDFWDDHVLKDIPPAATASDIDSRVIARLYSKESGKKIYLPQESAAWMDGWIESKAMEKEATAKVKKFKNKLKMAIGSASFGILPDGRNLSLLTTEKKGHAVKPTSYRTLREAKK